MSSTGKALKIAVDDVVKSIGVQVVSRGTRAVNALRTAELDVLKGTRSGRLYKKPNYKVRYRASAPGEPPAKRTGELRLNWSGRVHGEATAGNAVKITAELESNKDYSGYLDNSTPKMAARPYKDRIILKAKPEIDAIYQEPYS